MQSGAQSDGNPAAGRRRAACDTASGMRVARLLHSPVKSLRLTPVGAIAVGPQGVVGDRGFVLVDAAGSSLRGPKRLPLCAATATLDGDRLRIALPDGSVVEGDTPLGERIEIGFDMDGRILVDLVEGPWAAALSPFAGEPVRLARTVDGRGGWSGFPVSLIGSASIDALGLGPIDARRFRMLVEFDGGAPFAEDGWIGRDVRIGDAVIRVEEACARCAVTTVDPETGRRDVDALRAMVTAKGAADLGVYGTVVTPGAIRVGDAVSA